jgi:uncharacterized protein YecT (DUF1311 family)
MTKNFFSLLVGFLLLPMATAGPIAAMESSALVPNGWSPSLEQAETLIEDALAAKASKNQRFLTQTSQGMADLRDARLFVVYVQLMHFLDAGARRELFNEQKSWLNRRELTALAAVDSKGGSLEPLEYSEAFRKITEERLAELEKRLSEEQTRTEKNQTKNERQP